MRLSINHRTSYRYVGEVLHSAQYLHLTPLGNVSQRVLDWRIDAPGQITAWRDAFGNACHTLVVEKPRSEIRIVASGRVETFDVHGVLPADEDGLPLEVFLRPTPLTRADAAVRDFAHGFDRPFAHGRLDGLHALMGGVRERVDYRTGSTHVHSTAAEALEDGSGVCQDHAHVFIACCRALGVPARYVGGHLFDDDLDPAIPGAGHAWAAAWVDELGWVSFDVSNTMCGTERHVAVAVGLDYAGVAPVRGVRSGGSAAEELEVSVQISAAQQ